jgi:glutathione S-transferase
MTLKLFYAPGACSLAPHIALEEAGAAFEPVKVALAQGEQRTPAYLAINPKGRVPVLVDGDVVVTENPAILRYIARRFPAAKLWPEDDVALDAACLEWCSWMSNSIHVSYAHIRRAERYADDETAKTEVIRKGRETTRQLWADVDARLAGRQWAVGTRYTVADPYLLVFWTWGRGPVLGYDMARDFPNWTAHARRMAQRVAVQRAFAREEIALPV